MSTAIPARPPLVTREQNIHSSTDSLEARVGRLHIKTAVHQQPAPASATDDTSARQHLLNARRSIRCQWPECPAVLASLTIYANHLMSCHALSCKPTAPSLHTSLRAAFGGYECKLRPCTNQVHPDVLQLSKHLEASHVIPLCFTCPSNGCGATPHTLDMVLLHLRTVHKTTPDRLPTASPRLHTEVKAEPPELPEGLILPCWTLTTPKVLQYHKDLPKPAASTSREPLTPEASTQSTSNESESPRRGIDFPHSYEHLVYDKLDLPDDGSWREPCVGVGFDSDEPPADLLGKGKGRADATHWQFWDVRPVAEPDGLQLSAPPSNLFRPPAPPRAPTRSIFQAFRAEFMRKHPRAGEYAEDGEGDADDFDGDGWQSNWSFDGDTDEDDEPPPGSGSGSGSGKPSRESTASARRTGKKRKKRGW